MNCARARIGLICLFGLIGPIIAGQAAAAKIVAEIKVDMPLRDPSICRGQDSTYYLTGTVSTRQHAGGTPDFYENDGVYLWKSSDLEDWTPLGCVFNLVTQDAHLAGWGVYRWLRHPQPVPDEYREERVFGVVAPEIHYARGTFWLTISMSRQGTGLLRSKSGKPEGPYELVDVITVEMGDPSLFEHGEDLFWVFDAGFAGRLIETQRKSYTPRGRKKTMALETTPVLMQPEPEATGFPLTIGGRGAFMAHAGGRFHLIASERKADGSWNTFVASAGKPDGPYGRRRLLIPGGGQATLFENAKGQWLAACEQAGNLVIVEVEL